MSRKGGNITMQLNRRIDELLRIGEKKAKNDPTNSNRVEGIHSIRTTETYRSVARQFGAYLKSQHIRNIGDITRDHVAGFMASRAGLSAFTQSRDLSAINKLLDTRYTVAEFGLPHRSYHNITNNRGLAERDTSHAQRNREALAFVRACGMRRGSIARITPRDFLRDRNGVCIGVRLVEKGGRERMAVVLAQDRAWITQAVNEAITRTGEDRPFLKEPDSNANPHYCRGEYAQQLYSDLLAARGEGRDYYEGLREEFINDRAFEKAVARYPSETVRGFDRDTMTEVSQSLGHNRVDVVLYHYLKI